MDGPSKGVTFRRILLLLLVVLPLAGVPSTGWGQEEAKDGFEVLGDFPVPRDRSGPGAVVHVDDERRRLYYAHQSTTYSIIEYDLSTEIPQPTRRAELNFNSGSGSSLSANQAAADAQRDRLLFINTQDRVLPRVTVLDTRDFEIDETWILSEQVPGFAPFGITYAEQDDRIYLVGEMEQSFAVHFALSAQGKPAGTVPTIVALDAADGSRAWVRPIPQCQQPAQAGVDGTAVIRSAHGRVLYVACQDDRIDGSGSLGQTGLSRLSFPDGAGQGDAPSMQLDYFPVSGKYQTGTGAGNARVRYDPVTDRVFLTSLSERTPGVWVFDGRLETWVGQVATRTASHKFMGIDTLAGRLYVGGGSTNGDPSLLVTDGRATPPPQGFDDPTLDAVAPIAVDPPTRRMFVALTAEEANKGHWVVVRDHTAPIETSSSVDYDTLTADVPEGPDTNVNFTGSVRGFGSRLTLVGGLEGLYAGNIELLGQESALEDNSPFRLGDRGVTNARISSLDVGAFSATGAAAPVMPDESTEAERGGMQRQIPGGDESGNEESSDGNEDEQPHPSDALDNPYPVQECSDGSGEPVTSEQSDPAGVGEAEVMCDLNEGTASARTSFDGAVGALDEHVSVGASSAGSTVWRDEELGTVTESVARANALEVQGPAGSLEVAQVHVTALTRAKGRTGTSFVRWVRRVDGVIVRDGDGHQVFPPDGSASCVTIATAGGDEESRRVGSCQQLQESINQALQLKAEVRLPLPSITATPKGAFASVSRTDADAARKRSLQNDRGREVIGLEMLVFNDGAQKSRLVAELAAVSSDSIYTITQFQSFDGDDGPDLDFDAPGSPAPDGELSPPDLNAPELGADVGTDEQLVSQLSGFLSNVDPSQLVDPPAVASEPSGGSDMSADTGGVSSPPGMSTAPAPELGDGVDSGESTPVVAAPADGSVDTQGGDQAQAAGPTGTKMLARSAADAALVGGIWLLFLGAIVMVMRRASLLQMLRP